MKFVMLHEAKNDDGIKAFFYDVWELYVKVSMVSSSVVPLLACQIIFETTDYDESFPYGAHTNPEHCLRCSGQGKRQEILVITHYDIYQYHLHSQTAAIEQWLR
jgi:hypothetical protein